MNNSITSKIKELGYKIGCTKNLDLIPKTKIKEIIDVLNYEYKDVFFTNRTKLYVAEISTVDNEKDIIISKAVDYFDNYGNLDEALELGKITEEQYNLVRSNLD